MSQRAVKSRPCLVNPLDSRLTPTRRRSHQSWSVASPNSDAPQGCRTRSLRAESLREHPGQQFRLGQHVEPDVVTDARVFVIAHVAACGLQRGDYPA